MKNGKRDYKRENELYKSKPEQIAKRVQRNQARKEMMDAGLVKKGDGKHVDHIQPLSKGGENKRSNLRVISASANSSFKRDSKSRLTSQTSRRERKK